MPKSEPSTREKIKVHVYLHRDTLEEIQAIFPKVALSEIVRQALDRVLEKAKLKQKEILEGNSDA